MKIRRLAAGHCYRLLEQFEFTAVTLPAGCLLQFLGRGFSRYDSSFVAEFKDGSDNHLFLDFDSEKAMQHAEFPVVAESRA